MSLYTIGDLHLSFGCDKPMDVFSGWRDYVTRIEQNWQRVVKPDDTVIIVGDISWGMTLEQSEPDFAFIHQLNGKKLLLKGNHDYWFVTKKKADDFLQSRGFNSIEILHNNAFAVEGYPLAGTRGWINEKGEPLSADKKVLAREAGRLTRSLDAAIALGLDETPIVFMHYPPVYNQSECNEIISILNKYGIKRCYYGHIHGAGCNYAIDGVYQGIDYRLVSCDYTQFEVVKVL